MNTAQPEIAGGGSRALERPYRLGAGLGISLALHAALLLAWRHHQLSAPPAGDEPVRTIAVWLQPPPPPPQAQAEPPAPAVAARQKPARAPGRRKPAHPNELIAVPDRSPGHAEPPHVFSVEPAKEPAGGARFDRKAALQLAREMADDPDPARAGTAVGQIPPKPYATETKMARAIAGAKRRDCKDGLPGGLLGPLILLLDKKDSGYKW